MKRQLSVLLLMTGLISATAPLQFQHASTNNFTATIAHPGIVTGVRPVNCVQLRVRYRLDRTIQVENQNPGPEPVSSMFANAKMELRLAGHLVGTVVFNDAVNSFNLGGFDGTVDGAGTSGSSPVIRAQAGIITLLVGDPLVLADIVDVGAFDLVVDSSDSFGGSGPGNMSITVTSHAVVHGELAVVD